MNKTSYYKLILAGCLLFIISFLSGYFYPRFIASYQFKQVARAAVGLPWQFGGKTSLYQPVCLPTYPDGICKNCSMCGSVTGPWTCGAFAEVQFIPALGSRPPNFVCPTQVYIYRGGGTVPHPGGQILGGGTAPNAPWVIGISL